MIVDFVCVKAVFISLSSLASCWNNNALPVLEKSEISYSACVWFAHNRCAVAE